MSKPTVTIDASLAATISSKLTFTAPYAKSDGTQTQPKHEATFVDAEGNRYFVSKYGPKGGATPAVTVTQSTPPVPVAPIKRKSTKAAKQAEAQQNPAPAPALASTKDAEAIALATKMIGQGMDKATAMRMAWGIVNG